MTLKVTPAMASGLENHAWAIHELIEASAPREELIDNRHCDLLY